MTQSFTPKYSQGINWRKNSHLGYTRKSWEINCVILEGPMVNRKRAEYGFGEYGFKHRILRVFWPSPNSGERTQRVPLSLLFVCQSELTEFFAELTEFAVKLSEAQWVPFSETVLSKQYSARFLVNVRVARLQNEVFMNCLFELRKFSRKMLRNFARSFRAFICGSERIL